MHTASLFDPIQVRKDFPLLSRTNRGKPLVYLDNAATSQKPRVVIESLANFYQIQNSNVHRGVYELAEDAENSYREAREIIAKWFGISDKEVIFTRGTSEGINLIAHSFAAPILKMGDVIALTEMEHHANIVPWQMVAKASGAEIRVVPINEDGSINRKNLTEILADPRCSILSMCHISNVLGTVNPVKEIISEAHNNEVKVVLDGAQSVPHIPVNLRELNCDFFTFSGHKVFGPMGIGVVFAKENLLDDMVPYQGGGDMIDYVSFEGTTYNTGVQKFEAGTPNVAGAIGLAAALKYLSKIHFHQADAHEKSLLSYVQSELSPIHGLIEYGTTSDKAGVFCFSIDGIHPHDLATLLDAKGIATRTGHHCCQPLMKKLGVEATARASFSIYNTQDDAVRFVDAVRQAVKMLR